MIRIFCSRIPPSVFIRSHFSDLFRGNKSFKVPSVAKSTIAESAGKLPSTTSGSGSGSGSNSTSVANQAKDIIIFKYENPKFFRYLNLFAIAQFGFWTFISAQTLSLKDVPLPKEVLENEDLHFWQKINLGEEKYRRALALLYAGLGYAIFAASWVYILKSVRFIILRKDAVSAAIVTYTPFGKNRILTAPLNCISAMGSRTSGKSYIPIRLENTKFFYLLDSKGAFPRPGLFDTTVGVFRKFAKDKK